MLVCNIHSSLVTGQLAAKMRSWRSQKPRAQFFSATDGHEGDGPKASASGCISVSYELSLCGIEVDNMGFASCIMIPSILHLKIFFFFLAPALLVVVRVRLMAHLPVRRSWRLRCTSTSTRSRTSTSRGTTARFETRAFGGNLALVVIDGEIEGRAITDHAQLILKVPELFSV